MNIGKEIILRALKGDAISDDDRNQFDDWKMDQSSDDVVDLLIEIGPELSPRLDSFELLPCPFCGYRASMSNVASPAGGSRFIWVVGCNSEDCGVDFPGHARKVDAAKAWNVRSITPDGLGQLKSTQEALRDLYNAVQRAKSATDLLGMVDVMEEAGRWF